MARGAAGAGPRFEVTVHVTGDRTHLPYLMVGLDRLAAAGDVRFRLRPRWPHVRDRVVIRPEGVLRVGRPYPWSYDLDVVDRELGVGGRAAVDLQDWRDMFSQRSVGRADVLFKRMYVAEPVAALVAETDVRIMPAGITHGAPTDAWAHRPAARLATVGRAVESVLGRPSRLLQQVPRPSVRRPERSPLEAPNPSTPVSIPDGGYVFFQVRHHSQWGQGTEADSLTRSRAEVVRALRARFGDRFVGGIVFSEEPPAGIEDCASNLPADRQSYLELLSGASVVVSTNGFGESPPWKLAEYLESGAAIVGEPQVARLPEPLVDGLHLVEFTDPEMCADRCADLLDDPSAREKLGVEAASFYREHVAPEAAVWRYLTTLALVLTESA